MAIGSLRQRYVYVDDTNNSWIVYLARDHVDNVVPVTGLTLYNPANPPTGLKGRIRPRQCRRVYAEGRITEGTETTQRLLRRTFICNLTGALYESQGSVSVTYKPDDDANNLTLTSTGRRGEKITY